METFEPITVTHPELASEWSDKNKGISPDMVSAGSHDKVWWKGKCGHEWQAIVSNRAKGTRCPYCTGKKVLAGFNDLKTKRPDLAAQWHPEKNRKLNSDQIMPHSNKKVWWICVSGHEYEMTPNRRSRGHGCRICSNKEDLPGFNDLASRYPRLAAEWSEKNLPLTPDQVFRLSVDRKFWWKCPVCGNDYLYSLVQRLHGGYGCPFCEGFKVLPGFNDLATTDPDIAAEWHPDKNGGAVPQMYFRTSRKAVIWKCPKGHVYSCSIRDRAVERKECVVCEAEFSAALAGLLCLLYAKQEQVKAVPGYMLKNKDQVEVFLPDLGIGIETERVSSEMRNRQRQKADRCLKEGIRLFLIPRAKDPMDTARLVRQAFAGAGIRIRSDDTDNIRDLRREFFGPERPISPSAKPFLGKNGKQQGYAPRCTAPLSETNPELVDEWSERNYPFTINDEVRSSSDRVWWKGKCGHEWQAAVHNRAAGRGCPYCAGHRVLKGFNDFASVHPELLSEWSPKNGDLKPDAVTAESRTRVIWICRKDHEWTTSVSNRSRGNGCPVCAKEPLRRGENDLETTHPEVLRYWSEKNDSLLTSDIRESYRRQVWWKCPECGKDFQAQPKTEISYLRRYGAPVCRKCRKKRKQGGNING